MGRDFADQVADGWSGVFDEVDSDAIRVAQRIRRIASLMEQQLDEGFSTLGIDVVGDYEVLGLVHRHGTIRPKDVGEILNVTQAGVSGRIKRLVEAGLAVRVPDSDDGRSYSLHLSPAGVELVERSFRVAESVYRGAIASLPNRQIQSLAEHLRVILAELEPDGALTPAAGTD